MFIAQKLRVQYLHNNANRDFMHLIWKIYYYELVTGMEKDIHVSHKGQGAATNREKGQGVTRTRAGTAPCKNGLARTLLLVLLISLLEAVSLILLKILCICLLDCCLRSSEQYFTTKKSQVPLMYSLLFFWVPNINDESRVIHALFDWVLESL